jgi:hypothetical protein
MTTIIFEWITIFRWLWRPTVPLICIHRSWMITSVTTEQTSSLPYMKESLVIWLVIRWSKWLRTPCYSRHTWLKRTICCEIEKKLLFLFFWSYIWWKFFLKSFRNEKPKNSFVISFHHHKKRIIITHCNIHFISGSIINYKFWVGVWSWVFILFWLKLITLSYLRIFVNS